jgi:DNA invertase Pin-like site-specific DNA recombinase
MNRQATMTAREYLRVSLDKSGREKSNDEQHDDNVAAAPGFGIGSFGKPYRDTGSASRHARTNRDGYDQLLRDLGAGRFGADVLVLWESSRGSRKVSEWCELIELCEKAGVKIAVTTHGRCYDPANGRDRRTLLEDAVDSEYEVSKMSNRLLRAHAAAAVDGQPMGRIPYGYRRVYDPKTGRLDRQEPDPKEARVVVELFDRVAAGHSLTSIVKDFARRGITSRKGVAFSMTTLRSLLLAPRYAGVRIHSPNHRQRRGSYLGDPEQTYDAQWPALVSDDVFYAVRSLLTDPARTTRRPGGARHLLTMLARCDVCGGPLSARFRRSKRYYQCRDAGCVSVPADELDGWAEAEVLGVLTSPRVVKRLLPPPADNVELRAARGEAARIRSEHNDLIAQVASGQVSATLAAGSEPGILARLKLAEAKVQELTAPAGLSQLIDLKGSNAVVTERWQAMPTEAMREVVRLLFAPGLLGVLSVASSNGRSVPVRSRIRVDGKPLESRTTSR